METPQVNIDVETYSEIDLKKVGAAYYSRHRSTKCRIVRYSINQGDIGTWLPETQNIPEELSLVLEFGSHKLKAWNAEFERNIFENVLRIAVDRSRWSCTMVKALHSGLPPSLGQTAEVLGTVAQKDKEGIRLIRLFSLPPYIPEDKNPEDFKKFIDYCGDDVRTEMEIDSKLPQLSGDVEEEYLLSVVSNEEGLPINKQFIETCLRLGEWERSSRLAELNKLTGLDNANSTQQFRKWLKDRGYDTADLTKDTIADLAETVKDPFILEALEIKRQVGKTSLTKYEALSRATCDDGRLRGCFQFLGASRTGRDAGRIFQPQNLPRGVLSEEEVTEVTNKIVAHGNFSSTACTVDALSSVIRSSIQAPAGYKLVVSDLNAIESRVLAWISGCKPLLEVFNTGKDSYKSFASYMFSKDYEDVTKEERKIAKPAVLGCGYRMGGGREIIEGTKKTYTGLWGYARSMGVEMSEEMATEAVRAFRCSYPEIVQSWYTVEDAVVKAISVERKFEIKSMNLQVYKESDFLCIKLPSSRILRYYNPRIQEVKTPWGSTKMGITYEGLHTKTKKWTTLATHGGKLIENIVQAIARDILFAGFKNAKEEGFRVIGRVHDELITLVNDTSRLTHEVLSVSMCKKQRWFEDLPLKAEGFESYFYRK